MLKYEQISAGTIYTLLKLKENITRCLNQTKEK